jgi:hypothetical protein
MYSGGRRAAWAGVLLTGGGGRSAQTPELASARQELEQLLERKAYVDGQLAQMEAQLYDLEGAYLEETATTGNVVTGFHGYLAGGGAPVGRPPANRKPRFKETDRIFSRSSATYERVRTPHMCARAALVHSHSPHHRTDPVAGARRVPGG